MKITIQRSTLLNRLAQVVKAIGSKVSIPILEGVLIESNATLTLTCADAALSITSTLDDFQEHEAGAFVVPAKKLLEVIRKMPEKPIEIEVSDTTALIKCGSAKIELPTMKADEFPQSKFPNEVMTNLNGDDFARLVDSTKFAVSQNEQTPILQGVLFQQKNGEIMLTATDRHRLAKQSVAPTDDHNTEFQHVVPTKILETAAQIKSDTIGIGFVDSKVYIRAGDYQFTSSLHDGTYPEVSRIIPTSAAITVLVNTRKLLQTLELVEKIVDEKTKVVQLDISKGQVFVSAKDGGAGMEELLEAEVTGDDLRISANARYMIDALKCIQADRVEIRLTGAMSPVILQGENDESGLHLVLPYRTHGG